MDCICCIFKHKSCKDLADMDPGIQSVRVFSYKDLRVATDDFSVLNKLGEGGFASVYKGRLKGRIVAVKVLSSERKQAALEFVTELNNISHIEHENLVKLYGCCIQGDHRILVFEYLANNSLAKTLLAGDHKIHNIQFTWQSRKRICIGIAQGLSFLHEEVRLVHRDIKASNILLDEDLNPKIADFGLAKLIPPDVTHVSTRVAGTAGYLAPEYAVRGHLTRKADVYSFGILLLEIVSGKSNSDTKLPSEDYFLYEKSSDISHGIILLRAWFLHERNELTRVLDDSIKDLDADEACRFLKVGLLCTQDSPKLRPSMSTVVKLLTGDEDASLLEITKPGLIMDFMEIKVKQEKCWRTNMENSASSLSKNSLVDSTVPSLTFTDIADRSG